MFIVLFLKDIVLTLSVIFFLLLTGADISDYFNYGFTEETWKQYCEKQRRMRLESARTPYVSISPTFLHDRKLTVYSI